MYVFLFLMQRYMSHCATYLRSRNFFQKNVLKNVISNFFLIHEVVSFAHAQALICLLCRGVGFIDI